MRKETASSRLLLEEEIDQFHLEEEEKEQGETTIPISNLEEEFDRSFSIHTSQFIVVRIDDSLEEEGEMSIQRKSLHEVFAERNKVPTTKGTSDPPPPPLVVNPFAAALLKKKRKEKDIPEEGELALQKEPK